ncbi:MAG: 4-alpha-glucanotransferase, partial [Chloroflexota bacterium]|nr:4-alpha-glucanotransferase [Chloroflexota bacterium]
MLLHVTSLPGGQGIGDLGSEAYRFIDWLAAAGQQSWQILPLGPTGYGDSPYASSSAFAGNPLLISLERLVEEGLLQPHEVGGEAPGPVDFGAVAGFKAAKLELALSRFRPTLAYEEFCAGAAYWLEDFVRIRARLGANEPFERFVQFLFHQQWSALRRYANERGIRIVGDIPIFVADGSVDMLAHPELFYLDERGRPTVVAGVPPDLFSATGQRWGNPLFRWEAMAADGYRWWRDRLRRTLELVDVVRIDHFRGFAAYWAVPAGEATAARGRWRSGPGLNLFRAASEEFGPLPLLVEDLGLITPDVVALRERLGCPGMKVLQFAFEGRADNPYLPHNYEPNCVVYTGTHDNQTTRGWYDSQPEQTRHEVRTYLGRDCNDISWD